MVLKDSDKVLVHTVRALGNLFAIQVRDQPQHTAHPTGTSSSAAELSALTSCTGQEHLSSKTSSVNNSNCQTSTSGIIDCDGDHTGAAGMQHVPTAWWGSVCQCDTWHQPALQCLLASLNSQTEKVLSSCTVHFTRCFCILCVSATCFT